MMTWSTTAPPVRRPARPSSRTSCMTASAPARTTDPRRQSYATGCGSQSRTSLRRFLMLVETCRPRYSPAMLRPRVPAPPNYDQSDCRTTIGLSCYRCHHSIRSIRNPERMIMTAGPPRTMPCMIKRTRPEAVAARRCRRRLRGAEHVKGLHMRPGSAQQGEPSAGRRLHTTHPLLMHPTPLRAACMRSRSFAHRSQWDSRSRSQADSRSHTQTTPQPSRRRPCMYLHLPLGMSKA